MKTRTKILIGIGIAAVLVLTLAIGGWFMTTAFAQGPWQGGFMGMGHSNQAVLDLLNTTEPELLRERQAGNSWLEIAAAKGVDEQALTEALLQPMTGMESWMTQNYPQSNATQMTEWMRQQIAQDLSVAQYGTMTDMRVFGGSMMNGNGMMGSMMNGGMMGGNGMMSGMMNGGMMGNSDGNNGFGGMMGGSGMMGGGNYIPNVNATPVSLTQEVDQEINLTALNFTFDPTQVKVKKGETVKFNVTNQDKFAHNAVSQDGKLAYTVLSANHTTSILWVAPQQAGIYTVFCTWHPGMQFTVQVE